MIFIRRILSKRLVIIFNVTEVSECIPHLSVKDAVLINQQKTVISEKRKIKYMRSLKERDDTKHHVCFVYEDVF